MKIPDNTFIQSIDISVKNIKRSLNFYNDLLGFQIIEEKKDRVLLSSNGKNSYMISLDENAEAESKNRNSAGLYHTAFRFPGRSSLAKVFLRLYDKGVKFHGFSDHLVSEAIYLADPDGNGIELYVDKPKEEWKWNHGQVQMDTLPLNLSTITNEFKDRNEAWTGIDTGTVIGHIHLRVTSLDKAEAFYNRILGFNITNSTYGGALFMSAGGYHHHIGTNIWHTANGLPHQNNSLGLRSFTIEIPEESYINQIKINAKQNRLEFSEQNNSEFGKGISMNDYDNIKIKIKS